MDAVEQKKFPRFVEVDALRGVAVLAMIIYHMVYNLESAGVISLKLYTGFWWIFPRSIAVTFLLVVGISLTISYHRAREKGTFTFLKYLKRGGFLFSLGLIITLATWLTLKTRLVLFGILHMIGTGVILIFPLIPRKWASLGAGTLVLLLGLWLGEYRFNFYGLLWLGFRPAEYYPVDYLPLLPWLAYPLMGIFLGHLLYPQGKNRFFLSNHGVFRFFTFLGRHALAVYLIHHPAVFLLAQALGKIL